MTLEEMLGRFELVEAQGDGTWMCRCPGHDDGRPSLHLTVNDNGTWCVHCFACGRAGQRRILYRLGLSGSERVGQGGIPSLSGGGGAGLVTRAGTPPAPPADPDAVDWAYRRFLDPLGLTPAHRQHLNGRGLTDHAITEAGYKSREGILIPLRDQYDRIQGLQERLFGGGIKYRSRGRSTYHIPAALLGDPTHTVRLTEGALKADVIAALDERGTLTVGVPGAGQWRAALPILGAWGTKVVRLAFDRDAVGRDWSERAAGDLLALGYRVEVEVWDGGLAKGLDDLLALGLTPEVVGGEITERQGTAGRAGDSPQVSGGGY